MNSGEQMNLGTFRSIIRQTAKRHDNLEPDDDRPIRTLDIANFKITVIASYGPEGGINCASARFNPRP